MACPASSSLEGAPLYLVPRARATNPPSRVYYDLGLVLAETNRPVEAEEAFRHAVTLEPKDPDLLRALAEQLKKNGKSEEARTVIEQL